MPLQAIRAALRVHLRNTLARPLFQIMILVQPITMALLTYYVYGKYSDTASFFVVLGSGMSGMWMATAFSSAGDLGRERTYGTIQSVLISDVPLWLVSAGRALGALVLSVIPVVVSVFFSIFVLGLTLPADLSVPGLMIGLAVFGIGCHSFGLLLGNLFLLSRRTAVLQNFLEWPLIIASGVLFPVTALPEALRWLSAVLPMRWAAQATEQSFSTGVIPWHLLALAVGFSAVFFAAAVALFQTTERRIRVTGSLEVI